MGFADRLLTIVITATVTSAVWLVVGGTVLDDAGPQSADGGKARTGSRVAANAPAGLDREDPLLPPGPVAGEVIIPVAGVAANQLSDSFSGLDGSSTRLHEALDIPAARGTPVIAAEAGRVERLFESGAGGNTVYVRSRDGGTIYYYAHLDSYAPGLVEGQLVRQGAALGTVGTTGNAAPDKPHLHFAILRTRPDAKWWEPAVAINPYPLLRGR